MPLEIDYFAELIRVTSPTTSVLLQDLHDFVEDERGLASPEGLSRIRPPSVSATGDPIFDVNGKIEDPSKPGIYSQINLYLVPPWQIQFWGGSGYTTISGGKLSGGGPGDQPMKATGTAGDITVLSSQVDGVYTLVETGVSGLTPTESADLATAAADVETGLSQKHALQAIFASVAAKLLGADGTSPQARNYGDTKDRIVWTTDATGRKSVTFNFD